MRSITQTLRGLILTASLAISSIFAMTERADAVQITVLGNAYDISVLLLDHTDPLLPLQP